MARLSLQLKNVATLVLSLGTSIAFGVAAKRLFDTPQKPWRLFAFIGFAFLIAQIALLLFVESKEEEELSLFREERMAAIQRSIDESNHLSARIQQEMQSGNAESAEKWVVFRRDHYGK